MTAYVWPENSTNVRNERDPAFQAWAAEVVDALDRPDPATQLPPSLPRLPAFVRAGVAAFSWLLPGIAAAVADRLFMTPPRLPPRADEAATLARATVGSVRVGDRVLRTWTWAAGAAFAGASSGASSGASPGVSSGASSGGASLGAHLAAPSKAASFEQGDSPTPTVLLVHGWGGRGGQLHRFVEPLVAAGYRVVTFDGPGHGVGGTGLSSLPEQARAVREVAERVGPIAGIIAHSMGGAAASLALETGLAARVAVLIAPPFAAGDWLAPFVAATGISRAVRDRMVARIEARVGVRLADLTMARTAPRMQTPALVVHDEEDREVSFRSGEAIAARWPGATLHPTRGLGHQRILADDAVVTRVVRFVRAWAG